MPTAPGSARRARAPYRKTQRRTGNGLEMHGFATLMAELGSLSRHRCRLKSEPDSPTIIRDTEPTSLQARALEPIRMFPIPRT